MMQLRWVALACSLWLTLPAAAEGRFTFAPWRTLAPPTSWSFASGDLDGDGRSDLVAYYGGNGSIWVLPNDGSSFSAAQWNTVSPAAGWQFEVGEFSGDGVPDLLGYHPSNGSVWVGTNTGSTFSFSQRATLSPAGSWRILAGDFAGDARADAFAYDSSSGQLQVATNTGGSFSFIPWTTVSPAAGWRFAAGHFVESSGPLDLAGHHDTGSLWVGDNLGASFSFADRGTTPYPLTRIVAGEFTGDERTDLAAFASGQGRILVAANLGTRFLLRPSDAWADVDAVWGDTFVAGDFTGTDEDDVAGNASGSLRVGDNVQPLTGYAWPLSAAPAETIDFMLSGRGESTVRFLRHRADGSGLASVEMGSAEFVPVPRQEPDLSHRHGCGWPASVSLVIPGDWPSGIYSARLTSRDGTTTDLPFIVKASPAARSKVAVLANVNTWLAYNNWGGESHYQGAADLSFLRPNPAASPVAEQYPAFAFTHPFQEARGELWPLTWLADDGHRPDVYTDIDFHEGIPSGYDVLVLTTHPEYWSTQMYDHLQAFLAGGGSLIYLGGNGIYEAGEYIDGNTRFRLTGGVDDADRHPYTFRRLIPPRAERPLLGMATERCGVVGSPYRVLEPSHPILQCAELALDQVVGATGLHQALYSTTLTTGAAAGLETDTSNGAGATGQPIACGSSALPVPPTTLPAGLAVLAAADAAGQRVGEITYYDHPGGGLVLSAGSITFGGSLAVDADLQALVRCALQTVVSRQPVCDNGIDDDGDGFIDAPNDPGCLDAASTRENPKCQNALDDDGDGKIDFDGGASANGGVALGSPDPQCGTQSSRNRETSSCGFGVELVAVLGAITVQRRRRRGLALPRRRD